MRMFVRGLAALAVTAGFVWLAACGSSTGPSNASLSGNYTLTQFILGGSDLSQISSGTLALTDTAHAIAPTFRDSSLLHRRS